MIMINILFLTFGINIVHGSTFSQVVEGIKQNWKDNCDIYFHSHIPKNHFVEVLQDNHVMTSDPKDSFCSIGILFGADINTTFNANVDVWIQVAGKRPAIDKLKRIKFKLIHMNQQVDNGDFVTIEVYCPMDLGKVNYINVWSKSKGFHENLLVDLNSFCPDLLVNRPFRAIKT